MEMTESIKRQTGRRWWLVAAFAALALTILAGAAIYLITRKPSTIDQLVILTVPSGAEVKLNSIDYGYSPVKLEQLPVGTYTLTITKEGFETITEEIPISESPLQPLEFKLKPRLPRDLLNLSLEERQQRAEDAFAAGRYGQPFEESALWYAKLIYEEDPLNQFAIDMLERVRKALHEEADAAIKRGDFVTAKDTYSQLIAHYPEDKDAQAALARLDSQLAARKGEVNDLIGKAQEALNQDRLVEPALSSALYFVKQALAIDPRNAQAQMIKGQIRDQLLSISEHTYATGYENEAIQQLTRFRRHFPDDRLMLARLREWNQEGTREPPKPVDARAVREAGLRKHRQGQYGEAIHDLELAMTNNLGTPDVIYALADSYWKTGNPDEAVDYFRRVPSYTGHLYNSSIAAQGDISQARGDTSTALRYFKEALARGGSTLYSPAKLNDKIERIENLQREREEKPDPASVAVKHIHGGLFGDRSCQGILTVDSSGVFYKSSEHNYSANLVLVGVSAKKDEMTVTGLQSKPVKFKISFSEAERFRQTLSRFQSSARR